MGSVLCHFPLLLLSVFIIHRMASSLLHLIRTSIYLTHITFSTVSITYYQWVIFLLFDMIRQWNLFCVFYSNGRWKLLCDMACWKKGKPNCSSGYDYLPCLVSSKWESLVRRSVNAKGWLTGLLASARGWMAVWQLLICSLVRALALGSRFRPSVLFLRMGKSTFAYCSEGKILLPLFAKTTFCLRARLFQSFIC